MIVKKTYSQIVYTYGDNPRKRYENNKKIAYYQMGGKRVELNPLKTALQPEGPSVQPQPAQEVPKDFIVFTDGRRYDNVTIIKKTSSQIQYRYGDNSKTNIENDKRVAYYQMKGKRYDLNPLTVTEDIPNPVQTQVSQVQAEPAVKPVTLLSDTEMYERGRADAVRYYRGHRGAGGGTLAATLLTTPVLGLIPAVACASTPPKPHTLMYPNAELFKNASYANGYMLQAHKRKKGKVWLNWAIGTIVTVGVVAAVAPSLQ